MSTVTTKLGLTKPAGIEQFSVALYNNNLDIIDTYNINNTEKQTKGLLQKKRVTGSAAAPNTTLAVMENFASVTLKGGRHYRVNWHINNYTGSVANTYINIGINLAPVTDAANLTTSLTNVETNTLGCTVANTGQSNTVTGYIDPPSDTTIQIKFTAQVVVGTLGAISAYVCTVEDMGQQF